MKQKRFKIFLALLTCLILALPTMYIQAATNVYQCEDMTKGGQYAGNISSPFSGVALYANNDYCQTGNINFDNTQRTINVRGCSNNSSTARVVVKINGVEMGSVNFTGTSPTVQSITCRPQAGSYPVQLTVTNDNGSWDAYVDYIEISGGDTGSPSPTPTPIPNPGDSGSIYQCESMTKGGQYAGNISSPFSGVALYANNDYCQTGNINFDNTQRTISIRGCSNNSNTAKVVVKMNGIEMGSVNFTGTTPTVQSFTCRPQSGSYPVQLTVTNDDGRWDAYVDYLEISGAGGGSNPTPIPTPIPTTRPTPTPTPIPGGNNGNVYLAFDDGPNNNSQSLINTLKSNGVNQATLFVWGNRISSNQAAWSAYVNSGYSLQNHSWTHSHMTSWSYQQVYNDLSQCNQAIQNAGKPKPTKIRLPYLESNSTIQQACSALGLSIVQPNVDTQDWNNASTQSIVNACNSLQAGGNALMHDGYQTTNAAIASIVQNLKNRGLGFAQY